MDMDGDSSSPPSTPSSQPKRPAGRTKFRETRHPVFRGVRRRGRAGRWVCEVRVPGSGGARLWLGTFDEAETAARAHDAAMLALCGSSACLNFADSAQLLAVPPAASSLADVQRAAAEAVEDFRRREAANDASIMTSAPLVTDNATSSAETSGAPAAQMGQRPAERAALHNNMFEFDLYGGMDADLYYSSLAQGLLMEPPPAAGECSEDGEYSGAEVVLWSY